MKRYLVVLILLILVITFLSLGGIALANQVRQTDLAGGSPTVVSYQGQITDGGALFDGTGYLKFAIVDATGSTTYWSNDGTSTGGVEPGTAISLKYVRATRRKMPSRFRPCRWAGSTKESTPSPDTTFSPRRFTK